MQTKFSTIPQTPLHIASCFHSLLTNHGVLGLQWNLSTMDTLGPEKQCVIQRFPLFRGYFTCMAIYLDAQKQFVVERFPLLGELVIRGSAVYESPTRWTSKHNGCLTGGHRKHQGRWIHKTTYVTPRQLLLPL